MNKKFSRDDSASLLHALGQTIHYQRGNLDLTQEELAIKCGLHRTYISDIERGARNPSLITIHRIARALGQSLAKLMEDSEGRENAHPETTDDPLATAASEPQVASESIRSDHSGGAFEEALH